MKNEAFTPQEYRLIVVELDDVVPRREPQKPNLYLAITVSSPEKRFEAINRTKRQNWYAGHIKRLRTDLMNSSIHRSREDAKRALTKLTQKLMSEGYTVNRNTKVWTVYVVELDETVVSNPGKGYVYVGETSRTPEERFEQHLQGARNKKGRLFAGVVKRHGLILRPDLAPHKKYFDQASAKRGEREHFELLKSKGFNVEGGH